jgi:MFS family permease
MLRHDAPPRPLGEAPDPHATAQRADRRPASADERQSRADLITRPFVLIWAANFAGFLSFYLIQQPTLPLYVQHLKGSPGDIGIVAGAFSITTLAVRPFVGRAVDAWGRRVFVLVGAGLFVVCSLLYIVATTLPLLIALRLVHGAAMALLTTASTTFATDLAPDARRAELASYFGVASNLALGLGPLIAAVLLTNGAGFSAVFVVAAVVALVAVAAMVLARESPHTRIRHDGWAWETLVNRRALAPGVLLFTVSVTYGALITFLAAFAVQRGLGRGAAAWFWAVYTIVLVAVRLFLGRIADRHGRAAAIVPGLAFSALAMLLVAGLGGPGLRGLPLLCVAAILFSVGWGLLYPALLAMTIDRVGDAARGTAMATFSAALDGGVGGGAILFGAIAEGLGYPAAYCLAALAPLTGLMIYARWTRGPRIRNEQERTQHA